MDSTCARWSDRYVSANHWFIPADLLNQAANARTRAENVVNAALLAATAGPFYAFACHLLGFNAAGIEFLLCCACMLASPLLLRASGSIRAARELFLCALFFNFTWLSYHLGGIGAPTASWLITAPLVAMFLGGVASALFWPRSAARRRSRSMRCRGAAARCRLTRCPTWRCCISPAISACSW